MKVKVLVLAIGCAMMSFGGYAQKGVDSGTPFGHGEDSVRCVTNISLFVPYAKSGNFKDAYEFWKKAYDECPGAHKDIYLYGAKIYGWQISNAKDASKKNAFGYVSDRVYLNINDQSNNEFSVGISVSINEDFSKMTEAEKAKEAVEEKVAE